MIAVCIVACYAALIVRLSISRRAAVKSCLAQMCCCADRTCQQKLSCHNTTPSVTTDYAPSSRPAASVTNYQSVLNKSSTASRPVTVLCTEAKEQQERGVRYARGVAIRTSMQLILFYIACWAPYTVMQVAYIAAVSTHVTADAESTARHGVVPDEGVDVGPSECAHRAQRRHESVLLRRLQLLVRSVC